MELSKSKTSLYSSLRLRKQRLRNGLFIVEGEKSVADSLHSFILEAIIVKKGFTPAIISLSEIPADKIYITDSQGMDRLSSLSTSSPVIAVFRLPQEESFNVNEPLPEDLYLMLDGIQDPGNLGTIIRTAHWFGIKHIFASHDTADIFNPKTIQSTMGSLAKVTVSYCNLSDIIIANHSMPVYGLLLEGKDIYNASISEKGFIVMGNEGKGISPELRKLVSSPLLIPPYDASSHSESLNVAIATGITLAEFRRRSY